MRKLVVGTFLSLDGVMQAPGSSEEDAAEGFDLGGWSMSYWDEAMGGWMDEIMSQPSEMVLGRKTYDIFAGYWPNASPEEGAEAMNGTTKHVASRTLSSPLAWENSELLEGDAVEALTALKEQDGPDLNVVGSSNLIQSLLAAGLVDEFVLWIFPVVVGKGKRLFGNGAVPQGLKLKDSKVSTSGVILATYVADGEIGYKANGSEAG
jgi:dihydrofolate reductase